MQNKIDGQRSETMRGSIGWKNENDGQENAGIVTLRVS
jgi:hypothetical protein